MSATFGKIGARDLLYGKGVPRGYTKHDFLVKTEQSSNTYIDTGIKIPSSGDFVAEMDSTYSPVAASYLAIGGVGHDSTRATGFVCFGYLDYRNIYFATNYTTIGSFKLPRKPTHAFKIKFGIISSKMKIECESDEFATTTMNYELNGTERGNIGDTFMWGLLRNSFDNSVDTMLGSCRLYSNGNVVWDGIPCSRNDDGAVGYWDIVSRRFFPANAGFAVYDKAGGGKCIELSESAFYAYSSGSFWKEAA